MKDEFTAGHSIGHYFELQAARAPEKTALETGEQKIGYGEVNRRANRLAHYLQRCGVVRGSAVGIFMHRAPDTIVALLAALKCGAAYVPFEARYPLERLSAMVEEVQPPLVLTTGELLDSFPSHWGQMVCLDSDKELFANESDENPLVETGGEDAAYIMFTSGSTGKPKAVVIPHRGVVRLTVGADFVDIREDDRFLQLSPISFDASTFEIWGALANGATLCLPESRNPSLAEIGETLRRRRISVLWLTSALFNVLVKERAADLESVRQLLAGGDVLSPVHVGEAARLLPDCRFINGYGPTETTTFACTHEIEKPIEATKPVPIGKPINRTAVYILDENFSRVRGGEIGEIYIGGAGLAHGYLNNPDLTAERFVPNPFSDLGERLYKTGDLARFNETGSVEFLGRIDRQIKVRGFRIEPAEIENVLSSHPGIRESLVTALAAPEDSYTTMRADKKTLVAYIVPRRRGGSPPPENLRKFLSENLPDYLIPSAFVALDEMPLDANGKIDRRALPSPFEVKTPATPTASPQNETESLLCEIWREVLEIETPGRDDNFFDLGGDSIRSLQILAKLQEAGFDVELAQLFEHQTISELARVLAPAAGTSENLPLAGTQHFELITDRDRAHLPLDAVDAYPLGALQNGMLFHGELAPGAGLYHDVFSYRVEGEFSPEAAREALRETTEKHEILRTSFDLTHHSEPLQIVHDRAEIPLRIVDLTGLAAEAQEARIDEWIESEKSRKFDWSVAPLLRIAFHLRKENEFDFGISFHHAILDGWSLALLLNEFFARYEAILRRSRPELKPAQSRYADFIAAEIAERRCAEAKDFWQEITHGLSPTLLSAPERIRNAAKIRQKEVYIAPEVSDALKNLASRLNVPLKSVLLAVHLKIVGVLSGKRDVVSGLVTNGRLEREGGERVLGLFLNTLPLSFGFEKNSWQNLIKEVFAAETGLLKLRRFPLAEIQRFNGGQLFDTAFNFTHFYAYRAAQAREDFQISGAKSHTATNFPFFTDFSLDVRTENVELRFNYDENQFSASFIERIAGYFSAALRELTRAPEKAHDDFSPFGDAEKNLLLRDWNGKKAQYSTDSTIHGLFEKQVAESPQSFAVNSETERLTYAELDARANRLANYLLSIRRDWRETPIAFCVERSADSITALLAILKAGAPYVALDAEYPAERLNYMLEDSGARLLLVTERTGRAASEKFAFPIVDLDAERQKIDAQPESAPQSIAAPDNLAYVIYTSGSTGKPKPVGITHRAAVNHFRWRQAENPLLPADRFLHKASYGFDVSVWEVFGTLASGAELILAAEGGQRDGAYLAELIENEKLTVLHFSPAMWARVLDEPKMKINRVVRRVLCGGELLTADLRDRLLHRFPDAELFHQYGPTETTIVVTMHDCRAGKQPEGAIVPIGKPIGNAEFYVLSADLLLAPVGTIGELYIGGAPLARGYLGKPDLTAEKFIPHPFSDAGERLYKTGDLARLDEEGNIEFHGRVDDQIKIRGFRVELGEIEAAAAAHPLVKRCAASAARRGANDEIELAAYLETESGAEVSLEELRKFLAESLPDHLIPQAFFLVDEMPLTPNGKIDRRRLANLSSAPLRANTEYAAPATETENRLAEIWREVLDSETLGIDDDFFAAGGQSLQAIRVIARVREAFALEIPLRELFEKPTVREMAEFIDNFRSATNEEDDISQLLAELDAMSDEEAERLLRDEASRSQSV